MIGTRDRGIVYSSGGNTELVGYSDADFAGDVDTRRSTSGFVFFLSNGPVTWSSQRQKLVTLSTTESEYVALASATKEVLWLQSLLSDLECKITSPTTLYVDNQSAIKIAKNPEFHKRTKHIDIRLHFVREVIENKKIYLCYVDTKVQKADIFTKALPKARFNYSCHLLNMY